MKMVTLLLLVITNIASADTNVIYGRDNRRDVYAETNPLFLDLAKSTAALIDNGNFKKNGNQVHITGMLLGESHKLCEDQRFRFQVASSHCSGTLIAPDIIMTAGHCFGSEVDCKNNSWVFDFKASKDVQTSVTVPESSVYKCQKILLVDNRFKDGLPLADQALIKLDRPVTDRKPIPLARMSVEIGDDLVVIGHPWGIPTKIADGAKVQVLNQFSYLANLDAFNGNSGSGVFNARTGEVVGILSAGAQDAVERGSCTVVNVLKDSEGDEKVMKLDPIRAFLSL